MVLKHSSELRDKEMDRKTHTFFKKIFFLKGKTKNLINPILEKEKIQITSPGKDTNNWSTDPDPIASFGVMHNLLICEVV